MAIKNKILKVQTIDEKNSAPNTPLLSETERRKRLQEILPSFNFDAPAPTPEVKNTPVVPAENTEDISKIKDKTLQPLIKTIDEHRQKQETQKQTESAILADREEKKKEAEKETEKKLFFDVLSKAPAGVKVSDYIDAMSATGQLDEKTNAWYTGASKEAGEDPILNYSLKLAQQIVAAKEKELADYLASDEYKRAEAEYADAVNRGAANFQVAFSTEKQKALEAELEHYRQYVTSFSEQQTMMKDLAILEKWPEEDKKLLDRLTYSTGAFTDSYERLVEKYGEGVVDNVLETYKRYKNAGYMEDAIAFAQKHGGLGDSIFGIPSRIVGSVTGTLDYIGQGIGKLLGTDTGRYGLDTNTIFQIPSAFGSELMKQDLKEIGQWAGAAAEAQGAGEKVQNTVSDIATTVYSAATNAAENLTRVVATGGVGSLALAAAGSFQDAVTSATKQGANPMQAIGMGIISASLETITEKIPLDNLLSSVGKAGSGGWGKVVLEALKQAGVEVTTEEANFIGTTIAEAAILKEKSAYNQMIAEMVAGGMSYADAKKQADKALMQQAGQIAIQTALSGAMSSVGSSVINNQGGKFTDIADQYEQDKQTGKDDLSDLLDHIFAKRQPQQQPQTGEQITDNTTPVLPQSSAEPQQGAIDGKLTSDDLTDIIDEAVAKRHGAPADPIAAALESIANGGAVTNKQAQDIMNNTRAVQRLVKEAGLKELNGTASQNRAAVKAAVLRLSQQQTAVDTAANTNYDNINNTQGGNDYVAGQQQVDYGGVRRSPQIDSQGEIAGSTGNGSAYAGSSTQGGNPGDGNRGILHSADSEGRTLTSDQSARLQGTAVLDRNGAPIAVYHATDNMDFDAFAKGDTGFHFGTQEQAQKRSNDKGIAQGRIFRAYLNIKKPIRARNDIMGWTPRGTALALWSDGVLSDAEYNEVISLWQKGDGYDSASAIRLREILENKGYDGIAYPNAFEGDGDSYIAFRDDQIIRSEITEFANDETGKSAPATPAFSDESVGAASAGNYGENTVGGAQSRFPHSQKESKLYTNTYQNATDESVRNIGEDAKNADPGVAKYDTVSEKESLHNAELRTRTPEEIEYEYDYLLSKDGWSGEDSDTAVRILDYLRTSGDVARFRDLSRKQRAEFTTGGQLIQSAAKYSRTPTKAAQEAMDALEALKQSDVPRKFYKKKSFEAWKNDVATSILEVTNSLAFVEEGDASAVKDIVRSLANFRKTTAWFGLKSNLTKIAESALNDVDFEEAKDIAMAQIRQIPVDFQKRTVGEVVKTIRIHNMLAALTTVNRNLAGNASIGVVDALSDSTVGRGLDALVSLATKKRTVGNDVTHAKTYFTAGAKAARKAALCAELDIPMESESRYSTGSTRTFSPQGGIVTRFLSAYDKAMRYALEVTDKFFEGGTNAAVDQSLQNLGTKANLTEKEKADISNLVGQRRTFKDNRMMTRAAKKVKEGLNEIGAENIGLGDLTMPFAATGTNVGHTAIDYTSGGLFGFIDIFRLMNDVRTGKYENGEKVIYDRKTGKVKRKISLVEAQRQAVTNAARGLTGTGLVAAFTALAATGILGVHDDEDKDMRGLDQSQNLSGAQLNISAALRALTGESTQWQSGDWTLSVDFLEPFNAQMYLGYLLSQEDSVKDMAASYPSSAVKGVFQSLLDMPLMQNLEDTANLITSIGEADDLQDAAGQIIGNTASGFIPSWLRQTAQVIDPYYRDTTGQSVLEKSVNQVIATIPGLSKTLPKKYSGLGNEQLRYDNLAAGIFNTFVNPGELEQIKSSKVADFLDSLSESTGNKKIYPENAAPGSFTYDGKTIAINGTEMTEAYQLTYGENVNRLYGELIESADFLALDDTLQAKALEDAKTYATQLAKAAVSDYSEALSYIRDRPDGLSETDAIIIHIAENGIADAFDDVVDSWKTGNGSKESIDGLDQAYKTFEGISDSMQKKIIADAGGRLGYYLAAKDAGISTNTFAKLYKTYYDIDNSGAKPGEKASKWSYELEKAKENGTITNAQRDALKGKMNFWQMIPAETKKFDALTGSGISADASAYIVDLVMGIQPLPGNSSVKDYQKAKAITGADDKLTEAQQKIVLKNYLDEKSYAKYLDILKLGLDNDEYAAACELYALESDIGGKGTKERTIQKFMTEFLISYNVAKALYEIYNPK